MMPVATAAVGTIVPPSKRGMALGLVGMVYGVASVFGGSAGSLVLDIAGQENWQWIFYINVPIAVIVVALGIWALPQENQSSDRKLDLPGVFILVIMITALLWAFQNLDFTNISKSVQDRDVWVGLLLTASILGGRKTRPRPPHRFQVFRYDQRGLHPNVRGSVWHLNDDRHVHPPIRRKLHASTLGSRWLPHDYYWRGLGSRRAFKRTAN